MNIRAKIDDFIAKTVKKVSPKVQKEVKMAVQTSVETVRTNATKTITYAILAYSIASIFVSSMTRTNAVEDLNRKFNIVYNEVHNTYNFYGLKGEDLK